jgi:hypothetical protein
MRHMTRDLSFVFDSFSLLSDQMFDF